METVACWVLESRIEGGLERHVVFTEEEMQDAEAQAAEYRSFGIETTVRKATLRFDEVQNDG